MKPLTKNEKCVLGLLNYRMNSLQEDSEIKKALARIRKGIRDNQVANTKELISKLRKEKRLADKALKKQLAQQERKNEFKKKQESIEKQVDELVDITKLVTFPTKVEARNVIRRNVFDSFTSYARDYYISNKRLVAFMNIHYDNYKTGAHSNHYQLKYSEEIKIEVTKENDWQVYSRKTRFPAHHYTFTLTIPKNYSLLLADHRLVLIKGSKFSKDGVEVKWFEQSRGLDLRVEDGFLVRGKLVKKSKSIRNIRQAQKRVAERNDDTSLMRVAKIYDILL